MDTETEDEERENLVEPKFNKSELRKKIQENGGQVLSKFPGEKEKIPEHVVVISDRMCRTMTYLLSIGKVFLYFEYGDYLNSWLNLCKCQSTNSD